MRRGAAAAGSLALKAGRGPSGARTAVWSAVPQARARASLHGSARLLATDLMGKEVLEAEFTAADEPAAAPEPEPTVMGESETHGFQAETRQLLDIVAKSLYTDKEVFVRELISNSSDALSKLRHAGLTGAAAEGAEGAAAAAAEVRVTVDSEANTLTVSDSGIGMTRDDLHNNLGTIARSGSKAFVAGLAGKGKEGEKAKGDEGSSATDIIGRFGVGFYSAFMVAEEVTVYTRSGLAEGDTAGYCWKSNGSGSYTIAEAEGVEVGTKIVMKLSDDAKEFSSESGIKRILQKHSNFVSFPIMLNGERVNTVGALWAQSASSISEEQHVEFYRYVAGAYDKPTYTIQFQADAPIAIQALLYAPETHSEKYGMGRMSPGVSVYSRKVLIDAKSEKILPDWLRFMKGVVDSEDIPLNISREHLQDSALVKKVSNVVTSFVLSNFKTQSRKHPEKFNLFFHEFQAFFKEGVCSDWERTQQIKGLLRFDTSHNDSYSPETMTSFEEYSDRMHEDQKRMYYLSVPNRVAAEASPYFEAFKKHGIEVLFCYTPLDEFVFNTLTSVGDMQLSSIESNDAAEDLAAAAKRGDGERGDSDAEGEGGKDGDAARGGALSEEEAAALTTWLTDDALKGKVASVKVTSRLVDTPCIVVNHESAAMKRMSQFLAADKEQEHPPQELEINASHDIVKGLHAAMEDREPLARLVAEQLFDNALIAAGTLDDPRPMLPRMNDILARVLK